jgi:hypothetical protein
MAIILQTSKKEGNRISKTNIQINSMIRFDPPPLQTFFQTSAFTKANALLNAINASAIQPT